MYIGYCNSAESKKAELVDDGDDIVPGGVSFRSTHFARN